jgi:MFS family permease
LNRNLLFVALSLMTWGVGEGLFYFFQPLYLQELGADPVQIGGFLGLVGIAMMVSYLPAGVLSDRFGRRPMLFIAWILGTLATLLLAFAPNLTVFVAGMVVYGFTSFVTVPLNSYITAARGRLSVGRTITLVSAAFNFGAILGPLIGGWVGQHYGLQMNFRLALGFFILSTAFIFMIHPQPVEHSPSSKVSHELRSVFQGRFIGYIALMFFCTFGMFLPQPLTQNFLVNERGVALTQIGQLLSARSLGITVLNLVLGHLNARLGYLIGQAGMAAFSLLILRGTSFPVYLVAYFLMGSYMTARNLTFAQARTLVQSANMGMAYGLLETMNSLAIVLGPPLAGLLYEVQPSLVYTISLILILAGLAANLMFSPVRRKDVLAFEEKEKKEQTEWMQS